MSNKFYLAYRDLSEKELANTNVKNGFNLLTLGPDVDELLLIRPGVMSGLFGYPALHITHLNIDADGTVEGNPASYKMLIITYTNHGLTETERQQIAMNAFAYLVSLGAIKPNEGTQHE